MWIESWEPGRCGDDAAAANEAQQARVGDRAGGGKLSRGTPVGQYVIGGNVMSVCPSFVQEIGATGANHPTWAGEPCGVSPRVWL